MCEYILQGISSNIINDGKYIFIELLGVRGMECRQECWMRFVVRLRRCTETWYTCNYLVRQLCL